MAEAAKPTGDKEIRDLVRERYADLAEQASGGAQCCSPEERTVFGVERYSEDDRADLPDAAALASLGCGNPTAVADLHPGEAVLDLGSGGGIDVLLSARRVGPTGMAYGLDMTDEMLELAHKNSEAAGITNVRWLKGFLEDIPLPDESVDVVISNCVINLSPDKTKVLNEAARVLKPGGRFAVTDVIADSDITEDVRRDLISGLPASQGRLRVTSTNACLTLLGSPILRSTRPTGSTRRLDQPSSERESPRPEPPRRFPAASR